MAKAVALIVGHWDAEKLTTEGLRSWRDVNYLRRSTGASGERDFNWKVMEKLRDKLIKAGVQVHIRGSNYDANFYSRNYDLLVALHYDAGGTEERCMVSAPLRGVNPPYLFNGAQALSEKFCDIWRKVYPGKVGVPNRNERITAGMTEHYVWDYVKEDTPCAILEHFNHTSPRGTELKGNPELVAEADFLAIKEFLGITDAPAPTPTPVPDELYRVSYKGTQIAALKDNPVTTIENLKLELQGVKDQMQQKVDEATKPLHTKIDNAKKALE